MEALAQATTSQSPPTKLLLKAATECATICDQLGLWPLANDLRSNTQALLSIAREAPHKTTDVQGLLHEGGACAQLHLFWLHRDLATIASYARLRQLDGLSSDRALSTAYDKWLAPVHSGVMALAFRQAAALLAPRNGDVDRALRAYRNLDLDALDAVLQRIADVVPRASEESLT